MQTIRSRHTATGSNKSSYSVMDGVPLYGDRMQRIAHKLPERLAKRRVWASTDRVSLAVFFIGGSFR